MVPRTLATAAGVLTTISDLSVASLFFNLLQTRPEARATFTLSSFSFPVKAVNFTLLIS